MKITRQNYDSIATSIRLLSYNVSGRIIPAYSNVSGNVFPLGDGATDLCGGPPDHLRVVAVSVKTVVGTDRNTPIILFFIPKTDDGPFKGSISIPVSSPYSGASAQIFSIRVPEIRVNHAESFEPSKVNRPFFRTLFHNVRPPDRRNSNLGTVSVVKINNSGLYLIAYRKQI